MKTVFNLIIVDESGSMCSIQHQALTGMNETLQSIRSEAKKHPEIKQTVTLLTFDSDELKYHYNNVDALHVEDLPSDAYTPNAATPLYDAIGNGIARVQAKIKKGDKALVTIITDGYENSSEEYNLPMIVNLIDNLKRRGWTFTIIGADTIDLDSMAASFHIQASLKFAQTECGTKKMFERDRAARAHYNECLREGRAMDEADYFK